jgi:hypothetical protein
MAQTRKNGQFLETSYFENLGGLNNSDSPFKVADTMATGGSNWEYTQKGAIRKRQGNELLNATPDAQLKTRGLELYNTTLGTKTLVRAADRKIQACTDPATPPYTNLTQDLTVATSDVFPASTSVTTAFAAYNTDAVSLLNFCGGTDGVYSIYSTTKYTKNGATTPAGSVSTSIVPLGGAFQTTGNFVYSVSYLKTGTGAESNATLDVTAAVTATTDRVLLTLSTVTAVDTATYNRINVYRSAVNGSDGFTTGDLVATLTLPVASYTDTGSAATLSTNVPRANSVILDNSELPAGTYNVLALWKRRLVTATGNVLRFSDLNVPESWPTVNTITIPSGGPITGLAVISFNTQFGNDEYLAVFKERELWLVRGNDYTDITLSFVDSVGCPAQSLISLGNGFLTWIDSQGMYLWDGSDKPISVSEPISAYFAVDGDLDKTMLQYGWASYFRTQNTVCWFLSSKVYGEQKLCLKMDLRLTTPSVQNNLEGRVISGVLIPDNFTQAIYAAKAYVPTGSSEELLTVGDASGYLYSAYASYSDNGTGIDWQYYTPYLDLESPNQSKKYSKVILWVDELGDWDITLDYWAGYRSSLLQKSTLQAPVSLQSENATALWDVAYWDQSFWDDYTPRYSGVVFNLNNDQGNAEGDCIRLRFRNDGVNQPVTVYGYTIVWSEKGMTK